MKVELRTTKHSCKRALERLIGVKDDMGDKEYEFMDRLLLESVIPFRVRMIDGVKYNAIVEGYDNFRAVIVVSKDGYTHTIKTIIPIT